MLNSVADCEILNLRIDCLNSNLPPGLRLVYNCVNCVEYLDPSLPTGTKPIRHALIDIAIFEGHFTFTFGTRKTDAYILHRKTVTINNAIHASTLQTFSQNSQKRLQ